MRRVRNDEWQMQIDAETWQRLQKVRRHGETISDCIIRVIIVSQHRRRYRGWTVDLSITMGGNFSRDYLRFPNGQKPSCYNDFLPYRCSGDARIPIQ